MISFSKRTGVLYQALFAVFLGLIRTLVRSSYGKTYYPYFLTAARIPWRITRVPRYISVVMVILSVAKLWRSGMLRFFCIVNGFVHALMVVQCCAGVSLSPLLSCRHLQIWLLEGVLLFPISIFLLVISFHHYYEIRWLFLIFFWRRKKILLSS